MSFTCKISSHQNKPCITISNKSITIKVATSGGAIVSVTTPATDSLNPLWEPPWETVPVGLRRVAAANAQLFSQETNDVLESELLATIGGHSLCCDVFGKHSKGEVDHSKLSFHGEAGLCEWQVTEVTATSVTMSCKLTETQLLMSREYIPSTNGEAVVKVIEKMTNLCGFQRALGRSQHVTIGAAMLEKDHTSFSCNCDVGRTWPEDNGEDTSYFEINKEFNYPSIPRKDGGADDWQKFPRAAVNSDLCSMRVKEQDQLGWFVVQKSNTDSNGQKTNVMFSYLWNRQEFPWLMTWEENCARKQAPWNERTLCRGLEFGSYAMPLGRKWNVEQGTMFDTPTFEWLDAYEVKSTTFWLTMWSNNDQEEQQRPIQLISPEKSTLTSSEELYEGVVVSDAEGKVKIKLF